MEDLLIRVAENLISRVSGAMKCQLILPVRRITLTYETVRQWCGKFAQVFANYCATVVLGREIKGIWMKSV